MPEDCEIPCNARGETSSVIKDSAIIKEKLLGVSEIDSEVVKSMSEAQMLSFIQALNVTAAAFPLQKDELMHSFAEKDYTTLFQWLEVIRSSLSQMNAVSLAKECEKFININNDLDNIKPSRVRVFVDYFMPTLDIFITDIHKVLEDLEVEEVTPQAELTPVHVRDKILTLSELDSTVISQLSEEELCDYLKVLREFYDEFKTQENGLRNAMKTKHYAHVLQWLNAVEKTLKKLYAADLAAECNKQINISKDYNNIRHEKLEVSINYLLSSMSMLSTDIKALYLPCELAHRKAQVSSSEQSDVNVDVEILSPGSSPDAKTILIINKMTMFMNSFKNALSDKEHKLLGVTTAEAAISYLKTAKPDMFIIDEDLPSTDCYVLIKLIRATGQRAPIIFTASKIKQDKMVKYMEAGVADFIMKPITPADVQKKVSTYLH